MILIILKRLGNMPYLSIILKTFLTISLLLSSGIFFVLKVNYAKSLQYGQETIKIDRTQFGIPYIKAPSFQSAMYAWGYVTSEDRLFQLAFKRLIGQGKLSKYLGKKALNVDKLFRQLNFPYWANKTAEKMKRQNISEYLNFQSYVQGINDQVESLNFMPIQFNLIGLEWEPWTVADLFLQTKLLVWSQSMNMGEQYLRSQMLKNYSEAEVIDMLPFQRQKWDVFNLITIVSDEQILQNLQKWTYSLNIPKFNPEKAEKLRQLGIMEYLDSQRGSNSWVIHGIHTKSGLPILANDPHLQSAIPQQWHQIKVEYIHEGRTVFLEGAAMTGTPAIVGRSPYFTVGLTTIHVDSQDLYKEKVEGSYYELDGKQIRLKERKQLIQIKNEQSLQHVVKQTHRGPIISCLSYWGTLYQIDQSEKISLAWTGFHDEYQTWLANSHVAQITNVQQLKHFLQYKTSSGPNMNAIYTTIDNHIGYVAIGSLPMRRNQVSGNFIKDGKVSDHDWVGLIRRQGQLSLHDPPKGYIVTANNMPASERYQHGVYASSIMTARANRIDEMIQSKIIEGKKFTIEDMKTMQLDTVDVLCRQNLPHLLKGIKQANRYLQSFNCDISKDSFQGTIYEVFFYQLYKIIKPHKSGVQNILSGLGFYNYLFRYIQNHSQTEVKNNMNLAFDNTIKNLTQFFGTQNMKYWTWEKYHDDVIIHRPFSGSDVLKPFYEKRFGGRGNLNTVNVARMNKISYGDFTVTNRANIRMIWTYASDQKSYWIADTGISQKFYSRHYDDQFKLFTKDDYIQINFGTENRSVNQQL